MSHRDFGKKTIFTILVAGFCLLSMSSSAEAFWGCRRGWHSNYRPYSVWPSYTSFGIYSNYGYGRYGSGYGYGRYGSGYGYGRYGSGYGCGYAPSYCVTPYVGYGCFGYGASYGYGGYYSANTVSGVQPTQIITQNVSPSRSVQALATDWNIASPTMQVATDDRRAQSQTIELKINVPADARVIINDHLTTTVGSERSYVVRGARPEVKYDFVVRAEVERNGQTSTETKRVVLRGGQVRSLAFELQADPRPTVRAHELVNTTLKLRVPDDARVYLAGHEMKQNSGLCVFKTTRLQADEELADYDVRVTFMVNGQEESLEKKLTLVGGETQEFEFDATPSERLAAR